MDCRKLGKVNWISIQQHMELIPCGEQKRLLFINLRAVQLLLGHTKLESTVRYLGIEVDDALEISEQTEI